MVNGPGVNIIAVKRALGVLLEANHAVPAEPTMVAIRSITTNEHVTVSKVGTHAKKCQLESEQEELVALR